MHPESFALVALGGTLFGAAAAILLLLTGRTAGISGIVYGVVNREQGQRTWKGLFLLGLVLGGASLTLLYPPAFIEEPMHGLPRVILAGLLVGYGARLGGGCTSGHGICGVARLSPRSLAAVLLWIAAGAAVVRLIGAGGN